MGSACHRRIGEWPGLAAYRSHPGARSGGRAGVWRAPGPGASRAQPGTHLCHGGPLLLILARSRRTHHRKRFPAHSRAARSMYGTIYSPVSGGVLTYSAGSQRINLGEFSFMPMALQNLAQIKMRDPKAPVAAHYFSDVVSLSHVGHSIPRGIPHPAAAFLFGMWMTTPEAEALWQPILGNPNVIYGASKIDDEARAAIKNAGSRLVSWFDNEKTLAMLRYYGTKKGAAFRGKLIRALTQRR